MTTTRNKVEDLKTMFLQEGIRFGSAEGWDALAEHVEVHKYFISKDLNMDVTWDEALFSWYENVLTPLKRVVSLWEVRRAFPHQTLGDIYLAISDHWYYLKESDPEIGPEEAAASFLQHYGDGLSRFFSRFLLHGNPRKVLKETK